MLTNDQTRSINAFHDQHPVDSYCHSPQESLTFNRKYIAASSYSPTSYRSPPASSSLSAYVPNGHHVPRHTLNPLLSDESSNESSMNYHPAAATKHNAHFVVVAIDFGTTFSGYAFAFTRDIDSILMMRKVDGNDPGSCLPPPPPMINTHVFVR